MKHVARKRFGQNFLHDRFVLDDITAAIAPQAILLRLYAQWLTRQISSSFSNFLLTKRERTCPHIGQMRLASLLTISFYHEKPP